MSKNKKQKTFAVRDLSLAGQLTSHIKNYRQHKEASSVLYNGNPEKPRFEGNISKEGTLTLSHYGTPILRVVKKEAEILELPTSRKAGHSNGDLTAINTVLTVLGIKKRAIKRQGSTFFLKWEPVEL